LPQIGSFAIAGYFGRSDWLAKNKTAATGFVRAMVAADRDLAAHPDKYHQTIVSEFKMSAELADEIGVRAEHGQRGRRA